MSQQTELDVASPREEEGPRPMELLCYPVRPGAEQALHPSPVRRSWMDETPNRFAYRCLPLAIANSHGWELRTPYAFEATWDGGSGAEAIDIQVDPKSVEAAVGAEALDMTLKHPMMSSHFGSGVVTFVPNLIFRTPPGYNLWVSGPPNRFTDGIQALSAVIETDWIPYTFTMNWKMTRPGLTVRFEAGEPYCFFFPVARGVVERCQPRLDKLSEDRELADEYQYAYKHRKASHDRRRGDGPSEAAPWHADWYMRGKMPRGGVGCPVHQTKVRPQGLDDSDH